MFRFAVFAARALGYAAMTAASTLTSPLSPLSSTSLSSASLSIAGSAADGARL